MSGDPGTSGRTVEVATPAATLRGVLVRHRKRAATAPGTDGDRTGSCPSIGGAGADR